MTDAAPVIGIYLPDLSGGGAERLHLRLAAEWRAMGFRPCFLLDQRRGALLDQVPEGCAVETLGAKRQLTALPRLVAWLRRNRPAVLIANMEHMNVMAVAARMVARVPTRVIVTQHNALSAQIGAYRTAKWRALPGLYRHVLPRADAVVAVSQGVADDMASLAGWPRHSARVIYNGLVDDAFDAEAAGRPDHPWFAGDVPVVTAMGRMVPQKDFGTLLRGFAASGTDARLVILGDGPERDRLTMLAGELGIAERVAMPGFVARPLPWLRAARLFVLSSRFEGFGNVLVEALACGTPVVSTDCPHGPSEILDGGRYGTLVPPRDPEALGAAIRSALQTAPDHDALRARGRSFSVRRCADEYRALFAELGITP